MNSRIDRMMPLAEWHYKRINELTLEDCQQAYEEGFCSIFADGKIEHFITEIEKID